MFTRASLYDEADDREVAEELSRKVITESMQGSENICTQQLPQPFSESSSRLSSEFGSSIAQKISMRVKDEKCNFSSSIGQLFQDYISDYFQASREYDLLPTQKLQFMHNVFAGDAKRY